MKGVQLVLVAIAISVVLVLPVTGLNRATASSAGSNPSGVTPALGQGPSYYSNQTVNGNSYWSNYIITSGPVGHTWTVLAGIGLNGGDNQQYVNFNFALADHTSGYIEGLYGASVYNWVTQAPGEETQWGTMTAYIVNQVLVELIIYNEDGATQTFSIVVHTWYE